MKKISLLLSSGATQNHNLPTSKAGGPCSNDMPN